MVKYIPIELSLTLLFNQLFGKDEYSHFKENGTLRDFKRQYIKLLNNIAKAIKDNIVVCDSEHLKDLFGKIDQTKKEIMGSKSVEEINRILICFFTRFSFTLLGMEPENSFSTKKITARSNWKLDKFRGIQYVQTQKQKSDLQRISSLKKKSP